MSNAIANQQKYENYREQFKRLNCALANGFNLEVMFIEYAILEDRTESILRHAGLWDSYLKKRKGKDERNRLIHALLVQQLAHNEVSNLAAQGNELVKTLRTRAGNYNCAIERQKAKEAL